MRITCSQHTTPALLSASNIWPHFRNRRDFHPLLKLQVLFDQILRKVSPEVVAAGSLKKGKKRAGSPLPLGQAPKKRKGTPNGEVSNNDLKSQASISLDLEPFLQHSNGGMLPVWRHRFTLRYIDGSNETFSPEFRKVLSSLHNSLIETTTVDVGQCRILDLQGKLVAVWNEGQPDFHDDWLLLPLSKHEEDYFAILKSSYELQQRCKTDIEAEMKIILFPEGSSDRDELPFEVQIDIAVSIAHPSDFNLLDRRLPKKRVNTIREHQQRLCHFLYGRPSNQDAHISHNIDIPYFYSILTSAPQAPSQLADAATQPDALLPTLLPFQRRSVAWLLSREGKEVTPDGNIVSKTDDDYSFWETVQEGNNAFAYNRLAKMISTEKFATERSFGGILAEEPGLGKTLETLALILLNPAPADRTPAMIRWDPEARLDVKAVKTTLIVTPTSLAGQWVDEINAHAPSLKVLIYEGWSKVTVPILNTPEEKERVRKLLKEKKQKTSGPSGKVKKRKPLKTNARANKGKGKAKANDDDDFMEGTESTEMVVDEAEEEGEILDWCKYVQGFDIVVTTYAVLRSDFNVARAAIKRPRREDVSYPNVERPRSPLVTVEWMRVVMDEVQMVGGGKTEDMVSLIPRLASFAVSGTPARSHVSDLNHVLKFLRVDSVVGGPRLWNELLQPHNAGEFAAFFQKYSIRTVKADVKGELTIPQQTRYVVGIELGPIEREVYDQMLQNMLNELGLDAHGVAASAGWQVDATYLRSSLRRLRALCTHPQVGQLQRQGDKPIRPGALKTMEEVLEDLKDKNWRSTIDDAKTKAQGLCVLAQYQQQTQDPNRYHKALQTLQDAERDINQLIEELQAAIRQHHERGNTLRTVGDSEGQEDLDEGSNTGDKGKGREISPSDEDVPNTAAGEEYATKRRALQQRLREARLVLHRVKFLQGDVCHVLGGQYSFSETQSYGLAEEIRRELLKGAEEEASRMMVFLSADGIRTGQDGISAADLMIETPYLTEGCKSANSLNLRAEADRIIDGILNEQSVLLWEWRTHIIQLLSQKINPGEGEADGQEYQRTLENQGQAEVYLQLYAALLADRREALLHERTLLALHDVREKKLRQTAAATKAAAALEELTASKNHGLEIPNDVILQPEDEVTHAELSLQRKAILKKLGNKAVRTVASDLHGVAASYRNDKDPEKIWAKNASNQLRRLITEQESLHEKLDADLMLMRKVFNQRIVYFRQLQEISDSVIQAEWEGSIETAIRDEITKHRALDMKIRAGRSKQRYLANLVQNKGKMDEGDEEDTCTLCKCEFVRGFITQCAHIFCEGCMQAWMAKKDGRTCPMCRVEIDPTALQRFTVGANPSSESKPGLRTKLNGTEPTPQSRREITYNTLHPEVLEAIHQVEALGDFGSKIQTLVKHLLYLQVNDPGSKSIVFSAWADSLHIVQAALLHNGIRSLRIDQSSKGDGAAKIFRKDPNVSVLLLHGDTGTIDSERENAGLNLTCASRVFLLESVVHHGFELQAIARIDRLGQTRPTEVYCYYAENTVERNILDLAARQGLSLYTKENAAGTLNVSNFELDNSQKVIDSPAKKTQKGDFIFQIDDMLAILFPHMYEEVEYLVPEEANGSQMESDMGGLLTGSQQSSARPRHINAVAGPSRLG
ncbi:hypothetical protein D9756_007728 [Leucocoprinus leucothites]|uniref:Uncharacterized protein n=1 Tax=Leucocoprinus leucothites TaxID=201217 RepID=A0A8H5FX06_9AGAR|nr:hypothetical protein D9756_007728 [Leucoagaricus leucothites]